MSAWVPPPPGAYLHTCLSADQTAAVARPRDGRFSSDVLHAIYAREEIVERIERDLATVLALFCDPIERKLVLDGVARAIERLREASHG